jgi:hypothetical protein
MARLLTFAQRSLLMLGDDIAGLFHRPAANEPATRPASPRELALAGAEIRWAKHEAFRAKTGLHPANDNQLPDGGRDVARRSAARKIDLGRLVQAVPHPVGEAALRESGRRGGDALGCILVEDPVGVPAGATGLRRRDAI